MAKLEDQFLSYSAYHTTKGNKITHFIGIPLIVLSTVGLLSLVNLGGVSNLGIIVWLLTSFFYCRLDFKKGLVFSTLLLGVYFASLQIPWMLHLVFFVVGWVFQGIGHYVYEKKSPAFLTNLEHLLIGPFWIFDNVLKQLKIKFI